MSPLLSVRNLTTTFDTARGPVPAANGVSFDIAPGETLGLVGESGCGKSVTALSILKLIPQPPGRYGPDSAIEFDSIDLLRTEGEDLRRIRGAQIGMVFQEPGASLNPVITVGSQIQETIQAHESVSRSEARDRAIELLRRVHIPDPQQRYSEYAHQLSGGMQQRVMIAMAVSCQPKLLIADEPTTALDVTIQAQILDLFEELKEQLGMAMLFITHDLGVVAHLADRVAVMYAGEIAEIQETRSLFARPAHPYTQGLLRAIPRIDAAAGDLVGLPGSVPNPTALPSGCRFHPRCGQKLPTCETQEAPVVQLPTGTVRCWLHDQTPPKVDPV